MSPDIFISYSREDQQQVVQLVEYLRGQGLSVWMDETDIHGATIWTKEIVEAIRACTLFILAISGHSTGSKNVVKELALASEREKIILPIYLEQCEIPETMEYQLAGIQNIALYTLDKAKAYEFVHQTIRRLGVGQASEEGQALGQAAAAPSQGHGSPVTGHMPPPKAKGSAGMWVGIAAAVALVAAVGGWIAFKGGSGSAPSSPPSTPRPANGEARIALLPIEVSAATEDDQWVGGGMGTQLKAAINKLNGVTVISGVSVNAYRGANRDINKIRDNLSVHYILDCEMAVAGKNVTATVDFINASESRTVWSEIYEDNVDAIFAAKSAIASKIAETVGIQVGTTTAQAIGKTSTENTEAFKLYTKGRALWYTRSEAGMRQSLRLYEQAIALDPEFAEAYAGMADSYSMMGVYGFMEEDVAYPKAREFAIESITRNPNLAEPYVSLAWVQYAFDWKLKESEKNYRKAIELNPKSAQAYLWLGINLASRGQFEEAYSTYEKALKLDPDNHVILLQFGRIATTLGRFEEAESMAKRGLSVNPDYYNNWLMLYSNYVRQGGNEDEIENLVKEVESFTNKNEHIYRILVHYYKINNNEKFEKLLKLGRAFDESTKRYNLDSYLLFEGKFDEYMTAAEQAFKERKLGWGFWDQIGLNEYWDDPRLKAFMEQFWVRNAN
ncbi:MAG: TIR domain-containing protein [Verrucomicrobia bacterium]|nr:TIR domain-containing protein [Verrucomicrobiota bacterium]